MTDIQLYNLQGHRSRVFRAAARALARDTVEAASWTNLGNAVTQTNVVVSTIAVLLVGILYARELGLTFAGIIVFFQFVPNVFQPVQQLVNTYTQYQSLAPDIASTYELLDTAPTVRERPGARDMRGVHGHISVEGLTFGYGAKNLLEDVSFSVREGETVAVVGPIGCGKSTLLNLMLRFIEPKSGRIVIDGLDISEATLWSLRTEVSKLSQFPFFFKEPIRENIRLGRPEAGDDEVEEAARLAHVHDIIMNPDHMRDGYDTVVDERRPSGGQKRLIALARCLIRKPEVLLLDEPSENLDADLRARLVNVLRDYALERTCIVISHDLNFVAGVADRILVLNGGRIVQQGTHAELMAAGGLYKTLFTLENSAPELLRRRRDPADAKAAPPG
jgi:ABC-type multidrug transport system fused ATPase/permease subunit